jgi:phosphoserine phosphatase
VWGELKVSKSVQKDLRREYKLKAAGVTSEQRIAAYRRWCEAAVTHFRQRRLTRAKLREIATPLELTGNCRETLAKLRAEGVVTAIISGGISTFLEDRFPDFRDYLDFVFINELRFDSEGVVQDVVATSYDFEGKADALGLVCSRARCADTETVSVGDRFNDEAIMLRAQVAIAYPPMDKMTADVAAISITENDLSLILPHILVE